MSAKQSLGRGFEALIPKDLDRTILQADKNRVQKLLISDIKPNPNQPRRHIDKNALQELAASIDRYGVMQPIIVVQEPSRKDYLIVAGERRWRAARQLKHKDIPAIVRSLQELEQLEIALIENIQRVDLSPFEQALAVYRLQHQFNMSLEQVAEKLGKAPSTVSNLSRLLQLPEQARQALEAGQISEGHARAVLALKDDLSKQHELLSSIINNKWSVRQAEEFVLMHKRAKKSSQTPAHQALSNDLKDKLSAQVKIKQKKSGGQIIITFKDDKDLSRIAGIIK